MSDTDPELQARYRMPRVFGPLPGPRNVPASRRALTGQADMRIASVEAVSDGRALAALLPPRTRLAGEPVIRLTFSYLRNIGWLAGRGYNILQLTLPVIVDADRGPVQADFMPVLWESMADPIMTGREELGFAKLYAEIPPPRAQDAGLHCSAAWDGFTWCEMRLSDLADAPPGAPVAGCGAGLVHYRYFPRPPACGEADIAQLVLVPPPYGGGSRTEFTARRAGRGGFRFSKARWEDVPLQYPIINALAALPLHEFRNASVIEGSTRGTAALGEGLQVLVDRL